MHTNNLNITNTIINIYVNNKIRFIYIYKIEFIFDSNQANRTLEFIKIL